VTGLCIGGIGDLIVLVSTVHAWDPTGAFHLVASAGKERSAHARVAPGAFHLWRMPARASKARHSILDLPGLEKKEEGKKFSICAPFYECIPPVRSSIYLHGESVRYVIKLNQRLYVIFYCYSSQTCLA